MVSVYVVSVYVVGEHALDRLGLPDAVGLFVAMEFIEGQTLRQWVTRARPEPDAIAAAYRGAARGLAAVHDARLVHRDFQPDNVMRSDA